VSVAAALLALAPLAGTEDFELEPRTVTWKEACEQFDPRWILPEAAPGGRDLRARMRALLALTYEDGGKQRRLGDLVVEIRAVPRLERRHWIVALDERAPGLVAEHREEVHQLLLDEYLYSPKWKVSKDHPRDGLLVGERWSLDDSAPAPWAELEPTFEQVALLYNADLAAIKAAENDYRLYPDHVDTEFESIYPELHLAGEDDEGRPFRVTTTRSRSDLPFPFSGYSCHLRILNRIGDDGLLRCDVYSTSSDFHYLAGREVFLPVEDSEGRTVAYVGVRDFGFDLDGVPDRSKHRQEALRGTLGNLKRGAEAYFEEHGGTFAGPREVIEGIRVRGAK